MCNDYCKISIILQFCKHKCRHSICNITDHLLRELGGNYAMTCTLTFIFRINTRPFHCAGTFQTEEGPVLFFFLQNSSCQNVAFLSPWCCPQNNSPLPPSDTPPPPHTHTRALSLLFLSSGKERRDDGLRTGASAVF